MSANFFNGYAVDKPTSRVMAPPGGRSSNIFGYDEPAAPQAPRNNGRQNEASRVIDAAPQMSAQQEAAANKMHQNGGINLFDNVQSNGHTGQQSDANSITQSHRGAGIKPKDNSSSDIFGNPIKHGQNVPQNSNQNGQQNGHQNVHQNGHQNGQQNGQSFNAIDRQKSTVFEDEKAKYAAQPNRSQQGNNKPRSGYNTITGQTYEDEQIQRESAAKSHEQHQAVIAAETKANGLHTSSRVLQPPGGRSTGLW